MSAPVMVTGATGMLGSYVVERLVREGTPVVAFVRDPARACWLEARGARLAVGSLADREALRRAVEGCEAVVHAAAEIGAGGDAEAFRRGNVAGTENVVAAAASAGARLVHVSSTAVFGAERYRDVPTDEAAALPELPEHDAYGRTKQEAERLVLEAHAAGRAWATVVRPPVMYGRRDRQFAPRIGPVLRRGWFPLIDGGRARLSLVHADSVAQGAVRAVRSEGAGGRVYHLTDDFPIDVATLVRCAAEGLGRPIRTPVLSLATGEAGFAGLALLLRLVGRGDLARHAAGTLRMLTRDNPFTSRRARIELGWTPDRRPERELTDAFRWWVTRAAVRGGG